jgi:hypothetical protein
MLEVVKRPSFEGDSFLVKLVGFKKGVKGSVSSYDWAYFLRKLWMFENRITDATHLQEFTSDRPSLRFSGSTSLTSTNYAIAAEYQNSVEDVDELLASFAERLEESPGCRRCVLRLANPGYVYMHSTEHPVDVSCTLAMHFTSDKASIQMRASDVANELIPDLLLARDFFVHKVFPTKPSVDVELYSSTAQNVSDWDRVIETLGTLVEK